MFHFNPVPKCQNPAFASHLIPSLFIPQRMDEVFGGVLKLSFALKPSHSRSKLLHRHDRTEEQLLACSQSEEPLLDKLPCLYRHVAPDSWCDTTALMSSLRTIIWEEQKKIVWVEPDLW